MATLCPDSFRRTSNPKGGKFEPNNFWEFGIGRFQRGALGGPKQGFFFFALGKGRTSPSKSILKTFGSGDPPRKVFKSQTLQSRAPSIRASLKKIFSWGENFSPTFLRGGQLLKWAHKKTPPVGAYGILCPQRPWAGYSTGYFPPAFEELGREKFSPLQQRGRF